MSRHRAKTAGPRPENALGRKRAFGDALAAGLLAGPAVLLLLALFLLPTLAVFAIAVTDWQFGARSLSFVGLKNFAELFADPVFRRSLVNTIVYVLIVVPATVGLGLLIALLIESGQRLRAFYRAVHFLPCMATLAAMAIAWEALLHPTIGIVNQALASLGMPTPNWLRDESTVLPVLAVIGIWQGLGFAMVLFLAGLKAILGLQILVCAPAGYALAKLRFRGRDLLFALVLVGLLIPHQVLALPLFILAYRIGILDTYAALIFPFIVSPFGIFLFRQFFKAVPDDLVHAARLDGLSEAGIVWRVMVPIAWPAVVAFAIFSVVAHWNDLFWPLIAVRSEELMPPPLGIMAFKNEEAGSDYGPLMAGATLIVAPLVVAFLFAQRWFVDGLNLGAVK